MRVEIVVSLLWLAPTVSCHGAVTSYTIDGKVHPGYEGFAPATSPPTIQWQWPDYNPTMNVNDIKMRCNGGSSADLTATLKVGTNITANWKQWTHAQGPVMVWLYDCGGDFKSCRGDKQAWFKIDQMGLWGSNLNSENWGTAIVLKQLKWSNKIPSNLKPGKYLLRHELLALHQANTPQFYAECAQVVIEGSGTAQPPSPFMKSIPGYAPQNDPGITIDIYQGGRTSYDPPGGAVWSGFE